jgi:ribosomal protein S17E
MRTIIILLICICSGLSINAQDVPPPKPIEAYVAFKTGLNIREKPSITAKVLGKIPYSTKISYYSKDVDTNKINTDGFVGYYTKVTYNKITGYILNSYLLAYVPPKEGVKDLKAYLLQITAKAGTPVKGTKGKVGFYDSGYKFEKQLYKNGAEYALYTYYEASTEIFIIPNMNVQDLFLLVSLFDEYKFYFPNNKVEVPTKNETIKVGEKEYEIEILKNPKAWGPFQLKEISISHQEGAHYDITLENLAGDGVVIFSAGV